MCNGCSDLNMLCLNISSIAIITVKIADYRCFIDDITKCEAIHLLEIFAYKFCGYTQKTDKKNYKVSVIYFTRYVYNNSIKVLRLHYYQLIGINVELEGKNDW